jgi:hypothetical protein
MHNQHAELSQLLTMQRITQRHKQATHARLARGARPPRRRRRWRAARDWWQLARWPAVAADQPAPRPTASVDRSEALMPKLARALILTATVAALNLAGTGAGAQPNNQDATTQQESADNWKYYQQSTRVPPAELKARMQADAAQRELSERWTYYYHATRMSPAELKAWMQAQDRPDSPTQPPTQVPAAPVQPTAPNGQPTWLVVSLGGLAAALALVAGLALLAARRASRRARVGQAA